MLAKITRGNQVTIPKEIIIQAHLEDSSPYLEVSYANGIISLKPVTIEDRIPPEQYEKFQQWALTHEKDDLHFASLEEGIHHLKKRGKKH